MIGYCENGIIPVRFGEFGNKVDGDDFEWSCVFLCVYGL